MLTCIIRYGIDPTKKAQFERYARTWGQAIPRCGADLVGYFAPHEAPLLWLPLLMQDVSDVKEV